MSKESRLTSELLGLELPEILTCMRSFPFRRGHVCEAEELVGGKPAGIPEAILTLAKD